MTNSAIAAIVLTSMTVLAAANAAYQLFRAAQSREELVTRAEDLGADPSVLSDPMRRRSFLVRWADRYDRAPRAAKIREILRRAYLPWKPSDYAAYRWALGLAVLLICISVFHLPVIPSIGLFLAAFLLVPRIFFASRRNAYVLAFEAQLIEITQLLANSMRSGMSVQQSIGQVSERLPEPARGEFRQTHQELQMGDSLSQVLNHLSGRVNSRDLDVVVSAVVIQHQAGGNLARVLGAMANTLTERQRLASEIRSLTADARFSSLVVMLIPIIVIFMVRDTPLGQAIFETMLGWVLLTVFVVVQFGIYLLIQRIAKIEV
jgi:tight adherence protein B